MYFAALFISPLFTNLAVICLYYSSCGFLLEKTTIRDCISQLLNNNVGLYFSNIFGSIAIFHWTMHHPRNITFQHPLSLHVRQIEYTAQIETTMQSYETKMSAKIETPMVSLKAKMSQNHM